MVVDNTHGSSFEMSVMNQLLAMRVFSRVVQAGSFTKAADSLNMPKTSVSKLVAELIEKGDFSGIREAMEKSLAEGSQTFEQDIARLITSGKVDRKEGLAHADSPTNLMWRLQNDFHQASSKARQDEESFMDQTDEPSFTEITLDVKY